MNCRNLNWKIDMGGALFHCFSVPLLWYAWIWRENEKREIGEREYEKREISEK
jgi:hypothetical protein